MGHSAYVQLNEYETPPYFIQLSQNLMSDCLLICVFLPVFLQIKTKQFYDHIMQKLIKQVKTQKSTNYPMSGFGLIE